MSSENFAEILSGTSEELSPAMQAVLEYRLTLHEQHPEAVLTTDEVTEGIKLLKARIKARAEASDATAE